MFVSYTTTLTNERTRQSIHPSMNHSKSLSTRFFFLSFSFFFFSISTSSSFLFYDVSCDRTIINDVIGFEKKRNGTHGEYIHTYIHLFMSNVSGLVFHRSTSKLVFVCLFGGTKSLSHNFLFFSFFSFFSFSLVCLDKQTNKQTNK